MTDQIVFPGFSIKSLIDENEEATDKKIVLGPGIKREIDDLRAVKCGLLRSRISNNLIIYWIDSHQKRVSINYINKQLMITNLIR